MRLQHLALEVRDQQRAIGFYARFFRFDPATPRRYPDGVVILHDPDGFALALGPADAGERGSGFPHFGFEMDSPDEVRRLRARLVADGVELVEDEETEAMSGSSASTPTGTWSRSPGSLELRGVQVPARSDHERFEDS